MTRVEERLAELLNMATPTFEGVAFDDVTRRVHRRRTVMWSGAATAATVAAVVAAASLAGVSHPDRSSRLDQSLQLDRSPRPATTPSVDLSGAVPWTDVPMPPYRPPSASPTLPPATDARPCTADDVAASLGRGSSATGHHATEVQFRNTSRSTCVLKGYPQVTVTEPGRPTVTATDGSFFSRPGTANMAPGQDTFLTLGTVAMCAANPDGSATKPPYHHVSIRLPGGGTVHLDDPSGGFNVTCGMSVTEFYVPQPDQLAPPDPLSDLQVSLVTPATVSAGTTLVYAAELSNPTSQAISLTPCPGYVEAAGTTVKEAVIGMTAKEAYALNCAPVGAIAAHQTVRFEMRLRIPAQTRSGPLTIRWALGGVMSVTGEATVDVATAPSPARS